MKCQPVARPERFFAASQNDGLVSYAHIIKSRKGIKIFKEFIARGNVIDLAIAVIIGAAFGAIVTSVVQDIIMPPIGLGLGKVDFGNLFINLTSTPATSLAEAKAKGLATINYGLFFNTLINFLIIALILFFIVRAINRLKRSDDPAPEQRECPYRFSSISIKATRCPECTSLGAS